MHTPPSPPKWDTEQSIAQEEDALAGKRIGNYRLIERIGMGATALVYRAEHTQLGRTYAVKILHPSISIRQGMRERFLREAKTAGQLNHKNIIFIADFAIDPELGPYMVMEYLHGENLQDVLKRDTTLSLTRTKTIMAQVCDALAVAHQAGIIHRDLKPENIFLATQEDGSEIVKILDFGLARLAQGTTSLTGEGKLLGTPLYMSPEQCRGNAELTAASDIYSFGVVLFETLTGQTPFVGNNPQKLLIDHFLVDPPELPHHYPEKLRALQAELLAKKPEERPNTIQIVRDRLVQILDEQQPLRIESLPPNEAAHTHHQIPMMTHDLAHQILSEASQTPKELDASNTAALPSFPPEASAKEESSTQEQLPAAPSTPQVPMFRESAPPPSDIIRKSVQWSSPATPHPKMNIGIQSNSTGLQIDLTDPHRMTLQGASISAEDVILAAQKNQPVVVKQRTSEEADPLLQDLEQIFSGESTPKPESLASTEHEESSLLTADEELLKDLHQALPAQSQHNWPSSFSSSNLDVWPAPEPALEHQKTSGTPIAAPVLVEKGDKQKSSPPVATSRENRPPPSRIQHNRTEIDLSIQEVYDLVEEKEHSIGSEYLQPSTSSTSKSTPVLDEFHSTHTVDVFQDTASHVPSPLSSSGWILTLLLFALGVTSLLVYFFFFRS